ncbi:hypothetical protein KBY93_05730 [Synechococcus sp. J7-Johnson]|uniref:hypothetical protein n=1 Tax=Synechococcus sp. J7-Johnson TaxID=2823737 RepID=UPI0020CC6383|nr:hypothetical protein [Synechococcus sp. J7-Johnson]MCP9840135.1 hypothetical protein [Synechococcus sp. J7-Johnson]
MVTPSRPVEGLCHQPPEQQLTHTLACFQAEVSAIPFSDLGAVAQAARPVFRQGIGWSAQLDEQQGRSRLQVTVRHAAGAELSSETWADEPSALADMTGLMLAMLLGIPVSSQAWTAEPCDSAEQSGVDKSDGSLTAVARPVPDVEAQASDQQVDEQASSSGGADGGGDPALLPLTPEEISGYHRRVLDLPPAVRRELTHAFREHFQVPRNARSIGDRITQRHHGDFIERFLEECRGMEPDVVPTPPAP